MTVTKQQSMVWAIFQSRKAAAPVPIKWKYVEINIQTLYDIYIGTSITAACFEYFLHFIKCESYLKDSTYITLSIKV